jgi:hypothetical protein
LSSGRAQHQPSPQQEASASSGVAGQTVLSPAREQQQPPPAVAVPEVLAQKDAVHRRVSLQKSPTGLQRRFTARNTGYPSQVGCLVETPCRAGPMQDSPANSLL